MLKNTEIKVSHTNEITLLLTQTKEINIRNFQITALNKSHIKIPCLDTTQKFKERQRASLNSKYYMKQVVYLKNSITHISQTENSNLMPLNPAMVAKATNSSWVLSFPLAY